MSITSTSNKRIAKNTIMLYIRMIILMLVTLYTSRVILRVLGITDYGVYNIVGGVVAMVSVLNHSMEGTYQRFLNIELGRNDIKAAKQVFISGLLCQSIIILAFVVLAETLGLWYLYNYINLPAERFEAAVYVFQISVISSCVTMAYAPFNGTIIAHEKMDVYAYVSIIEALMKLGIVFLLTNIYYDKLISYSVLMLIIVTITAVFYVIYCMRNFEMCRHTIVTLNKSKFASMMSFSGWTIFTELANVCISQGLNMVQNFFFGVTMNAAMGIAQQVNSALTRFLSGFATAYRPQVVKTFAQGDRSSFELLVRRTAKFSFYLYLVLCLPIFVCCSEIMEIWLVDVPSYSVEFCRLMILYSLIDASALSLGTAIGANGQIKEYQIVLSIIKFVVLPCSILALLNGASPEIVLIINVIMNIITYIYRLYYVKRYISFDVSLFLKKTIIPCALIFLSSFTLSVVMFLVFKSFFYNLVGLILLIFAIITTIITIIFFWGLSIEERQYITLFLTKKNSFKLKGFTYENTLGHSKWR